MVAKLRSASQQAATASADSDSDAAADADADAAAGACAGDACDGSSDEEGEEEEEEHSAAMHASRVSCTPLFINASLLASHAVQAAATQPAVTDSRLAGEAEWSEG